VNLAALDRWITRPAPEPDTRCACCDEPGDAFEQLTAAEASMAHPVGGTPIVEGDLACPVCVSDLRIDAAREVAA